MDQTRKTAIEVKAEQVIQETDDQTRAFEKLRSWVEEDQELRTAVLEEAIRRELDGAIRRLRSGAKRCPYCSMEISGEALKCRHCGEWLGPGAGAAAAAGQTIVVGSRIWYFVLFTAWLLILFVGFLIYTFLTQ